MKILNLKAGDRYTFDDFANLNDIIIAYPIYGDNDVRENNKIIDIDGILINDVDTIRIDSTGDNVIVDFYNSLGVEICRRLMKVQESFEVRGGSFMRYSFSK